MNEEYFQRSAIAPVGIVAVVSMNTIWKRNRANDRDVIGSACQEEARASKQAEALAEQADA